MLSDLRFFSEVSPFWAIIEYHTLHLSSSILFEFKKAGMQLVPVKYFYFFFSLPCRIFNNAVSVIIKSIIVFRSSISLRKFSISKSSNQLLIKLQRLRYMAQRCPPPLLLILDFKSIFKNSWPIITLRGDASIIVENIVLSNYRWQI